MSERFAIYYAPATNSELWQKASAWLGRDCAAQAERDQPKIADIAAAEQIEMTCSPRRYGFHATIKPPFKLTTGMNIQRLQSQLAQFAGATQATEIGRLKVHAIGKFLALVPENQRPDITSFAQKVVEEFDHFRAPLSERRRQERVAAGLTDRQVELLDQWGYPYVMEQYKMHLTLTGRLNDHAGPKMLSAAKNWFGALLDQNYKLDNLALYHEPEKGAPFVRIADYPLRGEPAKG